MKRESGAFRGTAGEQIFYRVWRPEQPVRGVVVLAHGLSEHSGRYEHVARYLAERGVVVYAHDHVGHGRSGGRRGWVANFRDFLDDLERMHEKAATENPGKPIFLLGHSMGGLIAAAYVLERRRKPDYLILSGAAIVPLLDPGDRTIDPSRLSKDPAVQAAYMEDPLVLRERVTDELFERLADGLALLPGRATEIEVPWLLIHGAADPLCSAEGALAWLDQTSSTDRTVKFYEGGRHEMFNEVERDQVLADLWEWMDARLA